MILAENELMAWAYTAHPRLRALAIANAGSFALNFDTSTLIEASSHELRDFLHNTDFRRVGRMVLASNVDVSRLLSTLGNQAFASLRELTVDQRNCKKYENVFESAYR